MKTMLTVWHASLLRLVRIHQNTLYSSIDLNSSLQMEVPSSACGTIYWLKYKSYISIHGRPSIASEQMHRYLRCAFSETNWLTVFCLSLTAEVFLSGAAAVVNYSVSLQLIMAGEKRIGKERKRERERDQLSLLLFL